MGKQWESGAKSLKDRDKQIQIGVKGGQAQTRPEVHDPTSKLGPGEVLNTSHLRLIEGHLRGQEKRYKPEEPPDPHSLICRTDKVEVSQPEEELDPGPNGTPN